MSIESKQKSELSSNRGKANSALAGASSELVWTHGLEVGDRQSRDRAESSSLLRHVDLVAMGRSLHLSEVSFLVGKVRVSGHSTGLPTPTYPLSSVLGGQPVWTLSVGPPTSASRWVWLVGDLM